MTNEIITNECNKAAENLGITLWSFMRQVYDIMQESYDRDDIETWLQENEYLYNEGDIDVILEKLRDDYDCNLGTWDNIERAYYAIELNLSKADN